MRIVVGIFLNRIAIFHGGIGGEHLVQIKMYNEMRWYIFEWNKINVNCEKFLTDLINTTII